MFGNLAQEISMTEEGVQLADHLAGVLVDDRRVDGRGRALDGRGGQSGQAGIAGREQLDRLARGFGAFGLGQFAEPGILGRVGLGAPQDEARRVRRRGPARAPGVLRRMSRFARWLEPLT